MILPDRISLSPDICHGKPVVKHTRVLISNILSELATGASHENIIANYPNITEEDIRAALEFSSERANFESMTYEAAV
ncbi:MAG: DUF433 domain-containing protein [Chitinivibrionales bacterium]|nr:DUF433 domain-containing protein [Chitinivibrionales bacterium]